MKVRLWITAAALCAFGATATTSALAAKDGKALFSEWGCTRCHSVTSQKIKQTDNRVHGPDLSAVGAERSAGWMSRYIKKKVALKGKKHMYRFRGSKAELSQLTGWLATLQSKK